MKTLSAFLIAVIAADQSTAFTPAVSNTAPRITTQRTSPFHNPIIHTSLLQQPTIPSQKQKQPLSPLQMADADGGGAGDMEKANQSEAKSATMDRTDTEDEEDEDEEEQYRVILHNDEVHTFNYVIRSLQKVMGTLDRKKAFDICTLTHGQGQATIGIYWKQQAMKYVVGLQRQGLTASIAPDENF
eukprot:CAMPEP_0171421328 /NCGR_PEP_ID=MMETSP0881-20121228/546_1 /TAXON_ID=67004 /ORGANISM="Thalassiosira weissflogii, Strain CCMP1336" /LENGTH=185 /DNA_ID=CAMNT_0011939747 /DNA_START=64 /DNA_END=618 /DNA_ORIENTATION=+